MSTDGFTYSRKTGWQPECFIRAKPDNIAVEVQKVLRRNSHRFQHISDTEAGMYAAGPKLYVKIFYENPTRVEVSQRRTSCYWKSTLLKGNEILPFISKLFPEAQPVQVQ